MQIRAEAGCQSLPKFCRHSGFRFLCQRLDLQRVDISGGNASGCPQCLQVLGVGSICVKVDNARLRRKANYHRTRSVCDHPASHLLQCAKQRMPILLRAIPTRQLSTKLGQGKSTYSQLFLANLDTFDVLY